MADTLSTETETEENPLLEACGSAALPSRACSRSSAPEDLTRRKIFPALYSLALRKLLPEQFAIVGIGIAHDRGVRRFDGGGGAGVRPGRVPPGRGPGSPG